MRGLIIPVMVLIANSAAGQGKTIQIDFLGNCGLFMTDGTLNICIDFPYKSGAYGYMTYNLNLPDSIPENTIYIFTHGHADHFDRKLFKETNRQLFGPWPVKAFISGKRKLSFHELNAISQNFSVQKFTTRHRLSLKHYSYLIEWDGKRIYISGDAENADVIGNMKNLDLVFAPGWLLNDASDKNIAIDTKKIVLYHHVSVEGIINNSKDKIIVPSRRQLIELK